MSEKDKTLRALKGLCWHEVIEIKDYGGGKCIICKSHMSWYCPDSPDHQCHYFSEIDDEGRPFVESIHGEKILLIGYDPQQNESDDWCIFCGNPEERK